jgi:hypothetical protein
MLYVVQCGDYEGNTVLGATTDKAAAIREAKKRAEAELVVAQKHDPTYTKLWEKHDLSKNFLYCVSLQDQYGYSWDVLSFEDGEFYSDPE